ncbi:MAG: hypothetical protein H6838_02305 [Planctomycetes bacterium]|nr:hypothetical protein [Planctomycetota bacterium]
MPSAFVLIAALAALPQQPQDELAAAIATRNRHAVETMLAQDPSCRVALARSVRARLGAPSPPWLSLVVAWDPQSPRWPDGWKWPVDAKETAQRWVHLGIRAATGRPSDACEYLERAVHVDDSAVTAILGRFMNTADSQLQAFLWQWLNSHRGLLTSAPDEHVGTLLTGLFEHPQQDIANFAIALWSSRGGREGIAPMRDWLCARARRILKDRQAPLRFPTTSFVQPSPMPCPAPPRPPTDLDGEILLAAALVADADLAAAIVARRDEVLAKPTSSSTERSFWELCAIRASVKNSRTPVGNDTALLCGRLWTHASSTRRVPTLVELYDRGTALMAAVSEPGASEDLLDALAAQPSWHLDALAIDLDLGSAPDALRPLVQRLDLRRAPAMHAMVPDVLFDALRDGGDRMCFAFALLKRMAHPTVAGLLRQPAARERFLTAYRKAPLHPSLEPYVRERVEALLSRGQPAQTAAPTPTGEEAALIAATTADDPDVRLAAYRALATRDPAQHLCAWLLYEAPFDPDPRVRSLRLPSR